MKYFFTRAFSASLLFSAVSLALLSLPLAAADDTPTFRQADKSLAEAVANGDKKAVNALLDDRFQWVEANGRIHTKAQVLDDLAQFAADNEGGLDVRTVEFLGQVERVLGIHHNQRFAHLWVKNSGGWQAFVYLNIPIPAERPDYTAPPSPPTEADKVCENPCKTLPYKSENAAEEGAMETWFRLKNDEWHPNPEDWAAHADDNHETLTPRTDIPKLQHVEELAEERKLYGENGGSGGSAVLSMRMFDFGNVVIMQAFQGRNPSAKPTSWNLRVFLNRGDGWKIALSAQTNIT
ncbi:MAG TPA: nuclear transport factor 2 family protein [Candidatus Acidoferrales bacterium]|nr:nuclear transport factor 2 family protein [Candidatus Acidoferrales bacterium]